MTSPFIPSLSSILSLLLLIGLIQAEVIQKTFHIARGNISPDCVVKGQSLLVNKLFPGPPITTHAGDRLIVRVLNEADVPITIHWHGIRQKGTPWADGVPGVSQAAIGPGQEYTYDFYTMDPGSYIWHAHTRFHSHTIHGSLVVKGDEKRIAQALYPSLPPSSIPSAYDEERTLLLSDHYHTDDDVLFNMVHGTPFKFMGLPKAITFNGQAMTHPTCQPSPSSRNGTSPLLCQASCKGHLRMRLHAGQTYRFRIIGAGSWTFMNVSMAGHKLRVVEVDGEVVIPRDVPYLKIGSGQRYSVLVTLDQGPPGSRFWIHATPQWSRSSYSGAAELIYLDEAQPPHSTRSLSPTHKAPAASPAIHTRASLTPLAHVRGHEETVDWDEKTVDWESQFRTPPNLLPNSPTPSVPNLPSVNREPLLLTIAAHPTKGVHKYLVNKDYYTEPPVNQSLLDQSWIQLHTERKKGLVPSLSAFSASHIPWVYSLSLNSTIDIIIQLSMTDCIDPHPWHMHGHSFTVLEHGPGLWSPTRNAKSPLDNPSYASVHGGPIRRDTVMVYPFRSTHPSNAGGCGWRRIRLYADNPGLWPFHCHMGMHMAMGMQIVFAVGLDHLPNA
ncbi:MAG: Cupredoxin [Piptocephalis tieghemiana]|nr:MAG: Cupredoxin [Piptocephalis tieghemiana]